MKRKLLILFISIVGKAYCQVDNQRVVSIDIVFNTIKYSKMLVLDSDWQLVSYNRKNFWQVKLDTLDATLDMYFMPKLSVFKNIKLKNKIHNSNYIHFFGTVLLRDALEKHATDPLNKFNLHFNAVSNYFKADFELGTQYFSTLYLINSDGICLVMVFSCTADTRFDFDEYFRNFIDERVFNKLHADSF